MGYACYHSAVAIMNIILDPCNEQREEREELGRHLQLDLALLQTVKRFYTPANAWVCIFCTEGLSSLRIVDL